MLNYKEAIDKTLKFEGGYSNDKDDSGGETYCGISRNNWPKWQGWFYIDLVKSKRKIKPNEILDIPELKELVYSFYENNFIENHKLQLIKSQQVFNKVFDMCVNMGSYRGIVLLQQVLVNKGRYGINIDGVMGVETADAVNRTNPGLLVEYLKERSRDFYEEVVIKHPQKAKYLNNWLERAES